VSARTVAAIGIFAALAYAGSFILMVLPNATLSILIIFFAGYCVGVVPGGIAGAIAASLISLFNPYGMVALPLLLSQIFGYVLIGSSGGVCRNKLNHSSRFAYLTMLGLFGVATALLYHIPVSLMDAWLYGPFRERLIMSISFSLITVVSNTMFFVVFFPILAKLQKVAIFRPDD
jgi:uncharacterized membrane protein